MEGFKKKLDVELEIAFPQYFGKDLNHLDKLREYEILKIQKALGEPVDKLLSQLYDYFVGISAPKIFNPYNEECVLVENDKQHEELCAAIEECRLSVRDVTVFEFYSKIRYLEKRASKQKSNVPQK